MSHSPHSSAFTTPRLVLKKVLAKSQHEGDGAVVRRGIGRYSVLSAFYQTDFFYSKTFIYLFFVSGAI